MREALWIDERDAQALHSRLVALDGGAPGLRDPDLLQSALARPRQVYSYSGKPDVATMAAAYISGIIRNHPFIDGNKRTGFLIGVLFLELNGYNFTASEESATQSILHLAAGRTNEAAFIAWIRANSSKRQKS